MRNFAAVTWLFAITGLGSAFTNHDRDALSLVSSLRGEVSAAANYSSRILQGQASKHQAHGRLHQLWTQISSHLKPHDTKPEGVTSANSFFFPWSEESWFGSLGDMNPPTYALLFGTFSGLSLPLGAWLGITFSPVNNTVCAGMMAFGAGALLFAVTIEIYGHALHKLEAERLGFEQMLAMILGTFAGAIFYMFMSRRQESDQSEQETAISLRQTSAFSVQSSPSVGRPPELDQDFANEEAVPCRTLDDQKARSVSPMSRPFSRNPSISETGSVAQEPAERNMVKTHHSSESSWSEHSFSPSRKASWRSVRNRAVSDSIGDEFELPPKIRAREQGLWYMMTSFMIQEETASTDSEETKAKSKSVAMALFLGLFMDGIPEGILMGFLAAEEHLSPVFVLSIFLANFPEAFSSGSLFTAAGTPARVVMGMWSGLCLLTGLLAGFSCWLLLWSFPHYGPDRSHLPMIVLLGIALVQGVTGGSMLACISSVMLPDAFQRAGKEVHVMASSGLLCPCGFVLSLTIKALGG
mmetsp:Transcript_10625/g.20583  ORF Transcript_10625/g.20583 Transcript_10625/m.20583 type:complete len:525 (+) Transcript_10625:153-1727(+)